MSSLPTITPEPEHSTESEPAARSHHAPWPFIGRSAELASLHRSVAQGRSVLVVADDGVGKTALARRLAEDLEARMPVLVLRGNQAHHDTAYGAWIPVLAQVTELPWGNSIALLRAVSDHLSALAEQRSASSCLVLLDDVHWFDDESLQLATALTTLGTARLVALSRSAPRPPASLLALVKDDVIDRIDIAPLARRETEEVVSTALGGEVSASVLSAVSLATSGNPLHTRELLADLRHQGVLVRQEGTWVLDGPVTSGQRLDELVNSALAGASPAQREAIDLISLAEPVDLSWLMDTVTSEVVDELAESGWITVHSEHAGAGGPVARSGQARPVVRLHHSLYGEAVRRLVSPARRMVLQQRLLASAPPLAPGDLDGLLLRARWAVETGSPRPLDELVGAAHAANDIHDFELAVEIGARVLADTVGEPGHPARAAAAVELMHAHHYSGRTEEAHRVADQLGPGLSMKVVWAEVEMLLDEDRGREALALIDEAGERASASEQVQLARLRLLCQVLDLQWATVKPLIEADLTADGSRLDSLDLTALDDIQIRLYAAYARCVALAGDPQRAIAILRPALSLLDDLGSEVPPSSAMVRLLHAATTVAMANADWEMLEEILRRLDESVPRAYFYQGGSTQLMRGYAFVRTGRIVEAVPVLRDAASQLSRHDTLRLLPSALALSAFSASLLGDVATTTSLVEQASAAGLSADRLLHLERDALCTAASALTHGRTQAAARLTGIADEYHDRGLFLAESLVVEVLVRLGDGAAQRRLAALTERFDNRRRDLVHDYAQALSDRNAGFLLDVATRAEEDAEPLLAAEAAAQASTWLAAEGRNSSSLRARNLAQRLLLVNHGVVTARLESAHLRLPSPREVPQAPLTAREHEIRTLARSGLTNPEIAERLSLSRRTVENHLYRIYLKLGVESRESL